MLGMKIEGFSIKKLIEAYYSKLIFFALSIYKDYEESALLAEDIVHEVFLKIIEIDKKNKLNLKGKNLKNFIYKIARNMILNDLKRRKKKKRDIFENDLPQEFIENELQAIIADCINNIENEKIRQIAHLKYFEEMKIKDISYVLKIKEGSVKYYIFEFKNILAKKLNEAGYEVRR